MSDEFDKDYKKSMLDHVGPKTKNFCAAVFMVGYTLLILGFQIAAPLNRVAAAWARGYEIQNEKLSQGEADTLIEDLRAEIEALKALAHEPN